MSEQVLPSGSDTPYFDVSSFLFRCLYFCRLFEASQILHAVLHPNSHMTNATVSRSTDFHGTGISETESKVTHQRSTVELQGPQVPTDQSHQVGQRTEENQTDCQIDVAQLLRAVAGVQPGPFQKPLTLMLQDVSEKLAGG